MILIMGEVRNCLIVFWINDNKETHNKSSGNVNSFYAPLSQNVVQIVFLVVKKDENRLRKTHFSMIFVRFTFLWLQQNYSTPDWPKLLDILVSQIFHRTIEGFANFRTWGAHDPNES